MSSPRFGRSALDQQMFLESRPALERIARGTGKKAAAAKKELRRRSSSKARRNTGMEFDPTERHHIVNALRMQADGYARQAEYLESMYHPLTPFAEPLHRAKRTARRAADKIAQRREAELTEDELHAVKQLAVAKPNGKGRPLPPVYLDELARAAEQAGDEEMAQYYWGQMETPHDLIEQMAWESVLSGGFRGTMIERQGIPFQPKREPFVSLYDAGFRKMEAVVPHSGGHTTIHYWERGNERVHPKIVVSHLDRQWGIPRRNPQGR